MLKSGLCTLCVVFVWLTILCGNVEANPVSSAATPGGMPNVTLSARVSFISDLQCQKELVCRVDADNRALQRVLDISIVEKATKTVLKRVASIYYLKGSNSQLGDKVETWSGILRVNGSLIVHKILPPNKGFGDEDFVCKVVYVNWASRLISMESDGIDESKDKVCKVPDVLGKLNSLEKKFSRLPVAEAKGNVCIVPDLENAMAKLDSRLANLSDIEGRLKGMESKLYEIDRKLNNLPGMEKKSELIGRKLRNQSDLKTKFDALNNRLDVIDKKLNNHSGDDKKFDVAQTQLNYLSDALANLNNDKKCSSIETQLNNLSNAVTNLTRLLSKSSGSASQHAAAKTITSKKCGGISSCEHFRDSAKSSNISSREIITWPNGMKVLCDTQSDGGGWTIFQRRFNGLVNFYRTWKEYEDGFGDPEGEFWMGLKYLYRMMEAGGSYEMRIDLKLHNGSSYFAHYPTFKLSDACSKYKLTISGFKGTVGRDSMAYLNGRQFSTLDKDHDGTSSAHCAKAWVGGWWYYNCCEADLNMLWRYTDPKGVYWYKVKPSISYVTFTEMKVRRKK